ncbi:DUF3168 domain-containing protein [Aureliella helgolandensis]|uniref:DUF3168 domain-containing protein n=1 Tax=Aureliella helgolandensis TaxID=2527968 RepID=A0A518GDS6_9BACT|nr:DUF3168 domain-containing protein [Aureliella helgolandensis]QDV26742.1 hypothetical protein Q31a_51210 [Aureliella helgolandensis]
MAYFAIPKLLRQTLLANPTLATALAGRLHYQEIPQTSNFPHVWYTRSGRDKETDIANEETLRIERYTFEIASDQDAETTVGQIIETLEAFEGEAGDELVQLVEVEDADDDYIFQSIGEELPSYLHALQVAVFVLPL